MAASEEDKRLIGDIAPKKLDPSVTPVVEPVSTSSTQVSSTLIFFSSFLGVLWVDGYRNRFVYRHVLTPLSMIFYFENLFAFFTVCVEYCRYMGRKGYN